MFNKIKERIESIEWVKRNRWLVSVLYRAVLIIIYLNFFRVANERIQDFQIIFQSPSGRTFIYQLLGAFLIIAVGLGLYLIRYYWREQYGWIEMSSAAVFGYFAIGKLFVTDTAAVNEIGIVVITIAGCVYIVVRGMDNVIQADNERADKEHKEKLQELEDRRIEKLIDIKVRQILAEPR